MRSHDEKRRWALPFALMLSFGIAFLFFLFVPTAGQAASISGETNTILRMGRAADDRDIYPLYEYLNLGIVNETGGGSLSGNFGGWGRLDVRDKSADNRTEGAFQYGYISYRGNNNNLQFSAGRQFVAEGVSAERLDGLYLRNDFAGGFGAAAFVGAPVVTESNFKGGDITYGGRVSHSIQQYYSLGLSVLRTDYDSSRIREEGGIDLWLHPFRQIDVAGRSSYNSITSGWMEHAYAITFNPLESLRISADLSRINYRDYFHQVTTSVFSLTNGIIDPKEKLLSLGGSVELIPMAGLVLAADYRNYDYEIAGQAKYYGGKATFSLPESFAAGFSIHRMDGDTAKLRYDEYRLFASKKLGKADITADFFDVRYDSPASGTKNTYSVSAAVGYEIAERWKVAADIDYAKSADFDHEVKGLMKLTYSFDKAFGAEGGAK